MKKLITILLGALAAVTAASAQTTTTTDSGLGLYVRPAAVLAFPGHFDTAGGGSIAIGTTIARVHTIEVQAIRFSSRDSGEKVTFTPMLVNYDYHFVTRTPVTFNVGASVGATYEEAKYWWWHQNATAFTAGIRAGVAYAVTKDISIHGDITSLEVTGTDVVTSGGMALVSAGVTFHF